MFGIVQSTEVNSGDKHIKGLDKEIRTGDSTWGHSVKINGCPVKVDPWSHSDVWLVLGTNGVWIEEEVNDFFFLCFFLSFHTGLNGMYIKSDFVERGNVYENLKLF